MTRRVTAMNQRMNERTNESGEALGKYLKPSNLMGLVGFTIGSPGIVSAERVPGVLSQFSQLWPSTTRATEAYRAPGTGVNVPTSLLRAPEKEPREKTCYCRERKKRRSMKSDQIFYVHLGAQTTLVHVDYDM